MGDGFTTREELLEFARAVSAARAARDPVVARLEAKIRGAGVNPDRIPSLSPAVGDTRGDMQFVSDGEGREFREVVGRVHQRGVENLASDPLIQNLNAVANVPGLLVRLEESTERGYEGPSTGDIWSDYVDDPSSDLQMKQYLIEQGVPEGEAETRALLFDLGVPDPFDLAFLARMPWGSMIRRRLGPSGAASPRVVRTVENLEGITPTRDPMEVLNEATRMVDEVVGVDDLGVDGVFSLSDPEVARFIESTAGKKGKVYGIDTGYPDQVILVEDGSGIMMHGDEGAVYVNEWFRPGAKDGDTMSSPPSSMFGILDAADAHGVPVTTTPSQFAHEATSTEQLRWMYNGLGFEPGQGDWIREPLPLEKGARRAEAERRVNAYRAGKTKPSIVEARLRRQAAEQRARGLTGANREWAQWYLGNRFRDFGVERSGRARPNTIVQRIATTDNPLTRRLSGDDYVEFNQAVNRSLSNVLGAGSYEDAQSSIVELSETLKDLASRQSDPETANLLAAVKTTLGRRLGELMQRDADGIPGLF